MKLKSFIQYALTIVVLVPLFLSNTSCSRRIITAPPAQVNVNTAPASTNVQERYIPKSRKEIRLMKKARRGGIL